MDVPKEGGVRVKILIPIPHGNDLYEFYVSGETLDVLEIRVSRGNCNAISIPISFEELPPGLEEKIYDHWRKIYKSL